MVIQYILQYNSIISLIFKKTNKFSSSPSLYCSILVYIKVQIHTYTDLHLHVHTQTTQPSTYTRTYTHKYIHTYTHIQTNTSIHLYIHIHINRYKYKFTDLIFTRLVVISRFLDLLKAVISSSSRNN